MIRLLPFILILLIILGGLGYWRYTADKPTLITPQAEEEEAPVEVPKTLPKMSLEDRVKDLEAAVSKLAPQANKSSAAPTYQDSSSLDSRLTNVESTVTELKARVSALEKAPAPAVSQPSVYIPLGSGGGPWGDKDWYSASEYEISLDTGSYPGYKGMVLEATFRLNVVSGTGSVRLYNVTDSQAVSGQLDTTSNTFSLKTSSAFTLPTGVKTYKLQVKTADGTPLYVQSARIKVNF